MNSLLPIFILIPLLGFAVSLIIPEKNEKFLSQWAFGTMIVQLLVFLTFLGFWISSGANPIDLKDLVILQESNYEFFIDFYFDIFSAVYFLVGALITGLITIYSRYYMHRESGYKRYFNTVLFFYVGYTFVIIAGNLETLFIGWEILGIASFLLIAFYRNRYLPVKNAVKVFSVYRIGDVGLILAMWLSHHLWHENITFAKLTNAELVSDHLQQHSLIGAFISIMILITAAAKSAQFPFSSWLPRAMEGPTPSSAIFYGSLSVHLGAFLLTRTFPFWEHQIAIRVLIGIIGLITAIIASSISRVQSSVKSQIAYASMAQIGLIFIELALGLKYLALIHFAGNAFLRTYQLLVSPSVVSYLIREQFYHFEPARQTVEDSLPKRLEYSWYLMSLKEWNLESLMYKSWWNPMKRVGRKLNFLTTKNVLIFFLVVYSAGLYLVYHREFLDNDVQKHLPLFFSLIGFVMVLKAFSEKQNAMLSWMLVIMNHFWVAMAISFNERFTFSHVHWYLSGIAVAGFAGYWMLRWLGKRETIGLNRFYGLSEHYTKLAFGFLLACLTVSGFPISPTFIGEDLIFSHIHEDQLLLAMLTAGSLIIDGLAIIRIYARIFMGPDPKSYSYRSS
jgi:NADH:ubiquinone oxidoreductase subunit 5 (subunit L)/multisubunit Na+/H+ antiporter MnhA subunit